MLARCPTVLLVFGLATVLFLVGCASAPNEKTTVTSAPPPTPELSETERWEKSLKQLNTLSSWRVRGKVAYRLPDYAGSASLDWRQSGGVSRLRLSGPLGVGTTKISNEGALLRVERDGIARLYPADAAPWLPEGQLLPVPIEAIRYWLRGMPDPSNDVDALVFEDGNARLLEQAGWRIDYESYKEHEGLLLPRRLVLAAPETDLTLRIILRDWDLSPD